MIDIRKLRYFATVAELGSFTRAAGLLGVAQPALSRQVQQLEEELGIELLLREGRQVRLTDAGEALLRHAHTIDRDFERLVEDMQARTGTPKGRVVIGVPPTLADTLVPRLAERVRQDFPMISLKIAEGITPTLAEWVQNNKVDLAILSVAVGGGSDYAGLRLEPLAREDMIVAEKAGRSRSPRTYSLQQLHSKVLVLSDMLAMIVKRQLDAADFTFNVAFEIDAVQALKAMVLRGQIATILPVSMLSEELRRGIVAGSAITGRGVRRQLALAQPNHRQMTQAGEATNALVKEEMRRLEEEGAFSLARLTAPAARSGRDDPQCAGGRAAVVPDFVRGG